MLGYSKLNLVVLSLSLLTLQHVDASDKPPNFIIIFTDDMGYGDLSCYGNTIQPQYFINRL